MNFLIIAFIVYWVIAMIYVREARSSAFAWPFIALLLFAEALDKAMNEKIKK